MSLHLPDAFRQRWPLLSSHLDGTWTPSSMDAVAPQRISDLEASLLRIVPQLPPDAEGMKQRERLVGRLTSTLERHVRGSRVHAFGSAQTGLVLREGDVDLCLIVQDARPRSLLRHLANVLESEDYVDIVTLGNAKVPIVKFKEKRTGLAVDVSINNALALRNTTLIRSYVDLDSRVRDLCLVVKHWALHRGLADAFGGTLSSYAWTVLALRHLQACSPPLVPNLQTGVPRREEEVDGRRVDTTIRTDAVALPCDLTLAELLLGFFHRWFVAHDWKAHVVSLREGAELPRKQRGWKAPKPGPMDVLLGEAERMGEHVLGIEDPFDLRHDLSRVVRPEGWADLMEEGLRMWQGLAQGTALDELLQTVEGLEVHLPDGKGLFHDLESLDSSEVTAMLNTERASLDKATAWLDALQAERNRTIELAKAMRGTLSASKGMPEDQRQLVAALRERAEAMEDLKGRRDGVNEVAVLPMKRILEELSRLHRELTREVELGAVPSLRQEQRDFARFMAVQAMHGSKPMAVKDHGAYVLLLREQREDVKRFASMQEPPSEDDVGMLEDALREFRIRTGDVDEYDRRANRLQHLVKEARKTRKTHAREVGRLEAFLKRENKPRGARPTGRFDRRQRGPRIDVDEVRQRAMEGGTISLEDLGALLDRGGLTGTSSRPNEGGGGRTRQKNQRKQHAQRRPKNGGRRGPRGRGSSKGSE